MARALKIIKKMLLQLIMAYVVVFAWGYLYFMIPPVYWPMDLHLLVILITLAIGFMSILLQIRNYKGVEIEDFLESRHKISFDKANVSKDDFLELLSHQFIEYKMFDHDENEIIVKVEHSFFKMESAIIRFNIEEELNTLSIERSYLDAFPDNARNYKCYKEFLADLKGMLFQHSKTS